MDTIYFRKFLTKPIKYVGIKNVCKSLLILAARLQNEIKNGTVLLSTLYQLKEPDSCYKINANWEGGGNSMFK
jgi:hypothetical protein